MENASLLSKPLITPSSRHRIFCFGNFRLVYGHFGSSIFPAMENKYKIAHRV